MSFSCADFDAAMELLRGAVYEGADLARLFRRWTVLQCCFLAQALEEVRFSLSGAGGNEPHPEPPANMEKQSAEGYQQPGHIGAAGQARNRSLRDSCWRSGADEVPARLGAEYYAQLSLPNGATADSGSGRAGSHAVRQIGGRSPWPGSPSPMPTDQVASFAS